MGKRERKMYIECSIGGIAHQSIEGCPSGTKNPWGWAEGRLFEGHVLGFGLFVC